MKIRNGFVSNSSSSSFLLMFKKIPKSREDVQSYIWPKISMIGNPYDSLECYPVSQAADAVWEQIKEQKPCTREYLISELSGGWEPYEMAEKIIGKYDCDFTEVEKIEYYKKKEKLVKLECEKLCTELLKKYKKLKIYRVSFSDNDGPFNSTMEHGNVFKNIPNKQFSHH